jgi:hypothetical protein
MKLQHLKRLAAASILCAAPTTALARLGGFENADGYDINVFSGSLNWSDVSYYNAGAYGPNAGGGSGPTSMAPNSGLWKIVSSPGGFYDTAANRALFTSGAPPYPNSTASSGTTYPIYIVGNHFMGRGGTTCLAVRNDNQGTGPLEYDYTLDQYDMGVNPSSVTAGNINTSFYYCPNPIDPGPQEKFIMSFKDSSGNVGLQLGYERNNQVIWRAGNTGSWNTPAIIADSTNYDGWSVDVNLTTQTFNLNYFDVSTSLTIPVALAVPLGNPMTNLTHLDWWLNDSVSSGVGGKNFFDDFSFTAVPEPSSAMCLAVMGGVISGRGLMRRRQR